MNNLRVGVNCKLSPHVRDSLQHVTDVEEIQCPEFTFFQMEVDNSEKTIETVADQLAHTMVEELEGHWLEKIFRLDYSYFNADEQREILAESSQQLKADGAKRIREFAHLLVEHLESNTCLVIDGFVRFRLKQYWELLRQTLDDSVEAYLLEKEYKEFIKLLQYFVDLQEPKVAKVNVILGESGEFTLLDQFGDVIETDYLDSLMQELEHGELDQEDLLISALITVAPSKVVVHSPDEHHLTQTVLSIFQNRVEICRQCSLCQSGEQESKGN